MSINVLQVFANARGMGIPWPGIGLFTAILRGEGNNVALFDTTGYKIPGYRDEIELRLEKHYYAPSKVKPGSESEKVVKRLAELERLDVFDELAKKIQSFSPDLIMLTVTDSTFPIAVMLMREMKRRFKDLPPTLFGGVFPTFAPELAMRFPEVDMICVGEGENSLKELCRRMSRGQDFKDITGIWLRQNGDIIRNGQSQNLKQEELDNLPVPDYSLLEDWRFVRLTPTALEREVDDMGNHWRMPAVHAMRGCPFECAFCYAPGMNKKSVEENLGKFFRVRSVESVLREIEYLLNRIRANYIFFSDDTWLARPKRQIAEMCEMLKGLKVFIDGKWVQVRWWSQTRPETIDREKDGPEKIRMMKEGGAHWFAFGLEQGDDEFRSRVVRRHYRNEQVVEWMKVAHEAEIDFSINNIIGYPWETRELVFKTIELNREILPKDRTKSNFSASTFAPFFGSPLRGECEKAGFVHPDTICKSNSDVSVLTMPPPYLSKDQIRGLQRTFAFYVRFPKSRWPEIKLAEKLTPEGDEIHQRLAEEYNATFLQRSEAHIEDLPQPVNAPRPEKGEGISLM